MSNALTIDDIRPAELRDTRVVAWPGHSTKQVGLVLLRCDEVQRAHFAAREHFRRKGHKVVDDASGMEFANEEQLQYCALALIDPESVDPTDRLFANVEMARKRLSPAERDYFFEQAMNFQAELVEAWEGIIGNPHLRQVATLLKLPPTATPDDVLTTVGELLEAIDKTA